MRNIVLGSFFAIAAATALVAQTPPKPPVRDTTFAAMQERGKLAMGVDQYTSSHTFDALPTGGRIVLVRDVDDSAGVAQIRTHLRDIAKAFKTGDFTTPAFVHMQDVPGTKVMRERRSVISYEARDVARGGELRISTSDPDALHAIHEFMAFQRGEHHAGGVHPPAKQP